jgi:hypothetical protein
VKPASRGTVGPPLKDCDLAQRGRSCRRRFSEQRAADVDFQLDTVDVVVDRSELAANVQVLIAWKSPEMRVHVFHGTICVPATGDCLHTEVWLLDASRIQTTAFLPVSIHPQTNGRGRFCRPRASGRSL